MLRTILRMRIVLMLLLGFSLSSAEVFAQIVHDRGHRSGGNGHRGGYGARHYYHNGVWNRNGWYGWGIPGPVYSDGVLVASLPPGSTPVLVGGNTYFYGNNTYFRPMSAGGFVVVTVPLAN